MSLYNCFIGFFVVVLLFCLLIFVLILLSLLFCFIQFKCGCFEDFLKKEDLKYCCFEKKGGVNNG